MQPRHWLKVIWWRFLQKQCTDWEPMPFHRAHRAKFSLQKVDRLIIHSLFTFQSDSSWKTGSCPLPQMWRINGLIPF